MGYLRACREATSRQVARTTHDASAFATESGFEPNADLPATPPPRSKKRSASRKPLTEDRDPPDSTYSPIFSSSCATSVGHGAPYGFKRKRHARSLPDPLADRYLPAPPGDLREDRVGARGHGSPSPCSVWGEKSKEFETHGWYVLCRLGAPVGAGRTAGGLRTATP